VDPGGRASFDADAAGDFGGAGLTSAFGAVSAGGLPTSGAPDGDAAIVADGALALSSAGLAVSPGALGVAIDGAGAALVGAVVGGVTGGASPLVSVSRTSVGTPNTLYPMKPPTATSAVSPSSSKTTFDFFGATSYAGTLGAGATGRGAVALSDGGGGAGRGGGIGGAAPGRVTLDTPVVSTAPAGAAASAAPQCTQNRVPG
jgi:hypothetical protein